MSKYGSGSFGFFLVGGYNLINSSLQALGWKREAITEMAHGLGSAAELPTPVGVARFALTQSGAFFDDTANGAHALLAAGATATSRVVCFSVTGNTVGQPFVGCLGALTCAYEVLAPDNALTKANADYKVTGLAYDGVIVQPLATKTADWNTKSLGTVVDFTADPSQVVIPITSATKANPCVVTTTVAHGLTTGQKVLISSNTLSGPAINSDLAVTVLSTTTFSVAVDTSGSSGAGTGGSLVRSSTVNGAVGFQQVTDFTGFTGYVGKIQDSADDVTYADLVTFTNVTADTTAETVTVAGTVDRHLSFDGNVTGTGSMGIMAGLARL